MIEVRQLTKRYGPATAIEDVSFTVETGTICGLLGPNGAGKSTTMNIMTGCLAATSGEVRYDGEEIYANKDTVKRRIGYLPELPPVYPELTVEEYLYFVGRAKRLNRVAAESQARAWGRKCGLADVENRLIRNLSKGYRQRVGIAQALIGDPQTVILDEPTVGLDPIQIIEIRNLVTEVGRDRTVLVSSHILSEIRALCGQIVIISHGGIVADDTPENLERHFAGSRTTLLTVRADVERARSLASTVSGIEELAVRPSEEPGAVEVEVSAAGAADVREALFRAFAHGEAPILEMTTKQASLEDVFIELTGDDPALESQVTEGKDRARARSSESSEESADAKALDALSFGAKGAPSATPDDASSATPDDASSATPDDASFAAPSDWDDDFGFGDKAVRKGGRA